MTKPYPILIRDIRDLIELLKTAERLRLIRLTRTGKAAVQTQSEHNKDGLGLV